MHPLAARFPADNEMSMRAQSDFHINGCIREC